MLTATSSRSPTSSRFTVLSGTCSPRPLVEFGSHSSPIVSPQKGRVLRRGTGYGFDDMAAAAVAAAAAVPDENIIITFPKIKPNLFHLVTAALEQKGIPPDQANLAIKDKDGNILAMEVADETAWSELTPDLFPVTVSKDVDEEEDSAEESDENEEEVSTHFLC